MTRNLQDIEECFTRIRFSGDCPDYRAVAQELLAFPEPERQKSMELYYEILADVLKALLFEECAGTLSESERAEIFTLIRADWSDDVPGGLRASLLLLLGLIQPLAGVSEWLLPVANRQKDPKYADALRSCAACPRTKPAV